MPKNLIGKTLKKKSTNHLPNIHFLFFSLALVPGTSGALDLTFVPRIQAGVMDYEFEESPVNVTFELVDGNLINRKPRRKFSSAMPLVNAGVTAFIDSFFIDLYLQKAFSGSDSIESGTRAKRQQESLLDSDFDRKEQSLSIGYGIGKNWAVYGGYRISTVNFKDQNSRRSERRDENDELIVTKTRKVVGDRVFDQDGYFLGGVYALAIGEESSISLNLAVAFLDAKHSATSRIISDEHVYPDGREEVTVFEASPGTTVFESDFEGETLGMNLGISWKGRIHNKLGYSLGLNAYKYEFDGTDSFFHPSPDKQGELITLEFDRTFSEAVLQFSGGVSYEF